MFCENLKKIRNEKKYTQQEVADKLKVAPSTIGMYESGKRTPDISTLKRIAEIFNVSTDYLLDIENISTDSLYNPINEFFIEQSESSKEQLIDILNKSISSLDSSQIQVLISVAKSMSPNKNIK